MKKKEKEKAKTWFDRLKDVNEHCEYYAEGDDDGPGIYWNDCGDGIYICTVTTNRDESYASQFVELLNTVLSNKKLRETVSKQMKARRKLKPIALYNEGDKK